MIYYHSYTKVLQKFQLLLVGEVPDVPGLKPGPERWVQRVSHVLGNREAESNDPEVLADPHQLPFVELLFCVTLLLDQLVIPGGGDEKAPIFKVHFSIFEQEKCGVQRGVM